MKEHIHILLIRLKDTAINSCMAATFCHWLIDTIPKRNHWSSWRLEWDAIPQQQWKRKELIFGLTSWTNLKILSGKICYTMSSILSDKLYCAQLCYAMLCYTMPSCLYFSLYSVMFGSSLLCSVMLGLQNLMYNVWKKCAKEIWFLKVFMC